MAQGRIVPPRRVHRDQSGSASQTGGAVLQPTGNGGAVDQGRQERRQVDAPVLSRLCGQPSAVAAICAGVQSGQLSASGRVAPSGAALDADDVAGETHQDRREGGAPFAAGDLSDGRGGNPTGIVPDYSGKDW